MNTDKKSRQRLLEMESNCDDSDNFGLEHMSSDSNSAEEIEDKEIFWVMMMWMKS